jgi:hypothetical protein
MDHVVHCIIDEAIHESVIISNNSALRRRNGEIYLHQIFVQRK